MEIPLPQPEIPDIYSFGFDSSLNRGTTIDSPTVYDANATVQSVLLGSSGVILGDLTFVSLQTNAVNALTLNYGGNILAKEGGSIKFISVTAPINCTATLIATAVGNIDNGTHNYKVTYVNNTGETELGAVSNTVTVDAANKQVALSAIPISTSGGVIARKIYRTKANIPSISWYLLVIINDNTTTTYTDNTADASLIGISVDNRENTSFGKIIIDGISRISLGKNIFVGENSGYSNSEGYQNTAIGLNTFYSNTGGYQNTAIGAYALYSNTLTSENTAIGAYALYSNILGNECVAIGMETLRNNTEGYWNTAIGYRSLYLNTLGYVNTAVGYTTLGSNTTGDYNVGIGYRALGDNTTGNNNSAIGNIAGLTITTGNYNTFLGCNAGYNASQKIDAVNSMALGNGAYTTADNQVVIGNTSITETLLSGNIKIAGTAARATTAGTNTLHIFNGTAPAGTLTNGCSIYSTTGELYTMDAAGNATLQTPHDENNLWVFDSKNTVTGKRVKIDMEKMMRKLNDRFGWNFIHDLID